MGPFGKNKLSWVNSWRDKLQEMNKMMIFCQVRKYRLSLTATRYVDHSLDSIFFHFEPLGLPAWNHSSVHPCAPQANFLSTVALYSTWIGSTTGSSERVLFLAALFPTSFPAHSNLDILRPGPLCRPKICFQHPSPMPESPPRHPTDPSHFPTTSVSSPPWTYPQ